jgi:hypothetical protein
MDIKPVFANMGGDDNRVRVYISCSCGSLHSVLLDGLFGMGGDVKIVDLKDEDPDVLLQHGYNHHTERNWEPIGLRRTSQADDSCFEGPPLEYLTGLFGGVNGLMERVGLRYFRGHPDMGNISACFVSGISDVDPDGLVFALTIESKGKREKTFIYIIRVRVRNLPATREGARPTKHRILDLLSVIDDCHRSLILFLNGNLFVFTGIERVLRIKALGMSRTGNVDVPDVVAGDNLTSMLHRSMMQGRYAKAMNIVKCLAKPLDLESLLLQFLGYMCANFAPVHVIRFIKQAVRRFEDGWTSLAVATVLTDFEHIAFAKVLIDTLVTKNRKSIDPSRLLTALVKILRVCPWQFYSIDDEVRSYWGVEMRKVGDLMTVNVKRLRLDVAINSVPVMGDLVQTISEAIACLYDEVRFDVFMSFAYGINNTAIIHAAIASFKQRGFIHTKYNVPKARHVAEVIAKGFPMDVEPDELRMKCFQAFVDALVRGQRAQFLIVTKEAVPLWVWKKALTPVQLDAVHQLFEQHAVIMEMEARRATERALACVKDFRTRFMDTAPVVRSREAVVAEFGQKWLDKALDTDVVLATNEPSYEVDPNAKC